VRRFEFISGEAQRPWPGLGSVIVFEKMAGTVVEKEYHAKGVFIQTTAVALAFEYFAEYRCRSHDE